MKVAVIGLGIMGTAVVKRLLSAEHSVTVNNRTREKANALVELGAQWSATPAEASQHADVVITMVKDQHSVRNVTLGQDGILSSISASSVHCDMSTVSPQSAHEMAEEYASYGKQFLQAPVLGSKKQIEETALLIMAGGNASAIESCRPIWQSFAKQIWSLETASQAAALKLACNMLIAQMILGLGQSIVFAQNHGVDASQLLDVLNHSALGAPMYKSKGETILSNNFNANFSVENMLKDLTLASKAAVAAGISLPAHDLAKELFEQAAHEGLGEEDYSAVTKILSQRA